MIDPAELAQIQLHAEAKGVLLWFDYRTQKDGTRVPNARGYAAAAIKKFREALAKSPPASRPMLRLEA